MTKQEAFIQIMRADLVRHTRGRLSAWARGVNQYAEEMAEEMAENIRGGYINPADDLCNKALREKALLNGAPNWTEYSWGGCALCYDYAIAKRLCRPSELRKTRDGARKPNRFEEWLDVQARALFQASLQMHSALKFAYDKVYGQL